MLRRTTDSDTAVRLDFGQRPGLVAEPWPAARRRSSPGLPIERVTIPMSKGKPGQICQNCREGIIELKRRNRRVAPKGMDCVTRAARHQQGKMPC